jgi:F0F1-type ATP synthase assembly protein I
MKKDSWSLALRTMAQISGWIAFPVIVGLFLGKWLDKKYGTEPWLFLTTIGVCFLISIYGLIINALKEFKKIEAEANQEKENQVENKKIIEIK